MSDRNERTAHQDGSSSNQSAGQQGVNSGRREGDVQNGRPNPATIDLRDAPGYEAGQRAIDRGVGSQCAQGEDDRRDAGVGTSASHADRAAEDDVVQRDGFYGSDRAARADGSDTSAGSTGSAGSDAANRPDAAHGPAGAAGSDGSDGSTGSTGSSDSDPSELEVVGTR